jgi:hypothetical protein
MSQHPIAMLLVVKLGQPGGAARHDAGCLVGEERREAGGAYFGGLVLASIRERSTVGSSEAACGVCTAGRVMKLWPTAW